MKFINIIHQQLNEVYRLDVMRGSKEKELCRATIKDGQTNVYDEEHRGYSTIMTRQFSETRKSAIYDDKETSLQ